MTKTLHAPLTRVCIDRRSLIAASAVGGLGLTGLRGASAQDLPEVTVGSKDFTEQIIISEMAALLLENAGHPVERQLNLGGSGIVHAAVVSGEIDMYLEYTGTGLLAHLGMQLPAATPGADAATPMAGATPTAGGMDAIYDIVKQEYQEQFDLVWLQPWGFNNTYVLAIRQDTAEQLGITTTSGLVGQESDLIFGATQEFLIRPDGLPGLEAAYGLDFSEEVGLDPGLVYSALDEGDVDIISAFATDGRIPQLGLVTLEDDLGFFPPYFAAPVVRQELLDESPEVADVLNVMAGRIDNATMANLNAEVDVNGVEPIDVARGYLNAQDLLGNLAE